VTFRWSKEIAGADSQPEVNRNLGEITTNTNKRFTFQDVFINKRLLTRTTWSSLLNFLKYPSSLKTQIILGDGDLFTDMGAREAPEVGDIPVLNDVALSGFLQRPDVVVRREDDRRAVAPPADLVDLGFIGADARGGVAPATEDPDLLRRASERGDGQGLILDATICNGELFTGRAESAVVDDIATIRRLGNCGCDTVEDCK